MLDPSANTRFGDVRRFDEVESTNTVAANLAREGAGDGLVVVADHQTAGRGRLGRRWQAPPGTSLLVSVLLRPGPPPGHAHLPMIAMALAASDACEAVCGGVRPLLKWPNDLVVGDRKVGGILGEATAESAVVGLGLNVAWGDVDPPPPGGSLDGLAGRPVSRDDLLDALLTALADRLAQETAGLLDDYRARSATLGRRVAVALWAGKVEGEATGITPDGHLIVDDGVRVHVITAGDVIHLRPAGDGSP